MSDLPILFYCPSCDAFLSADSEQDGEGAVCPMCGTEFIVPDPQHSQVKIVAEALPWNSAPKRAISDGEMDMTPMVDVTFLLLIFFMVTATFSVQKSVEVPVPNNQQPSLSANSISNPDQDPDVVTVRIDEYNTYFLSGSAWDEEQEAPSRQELVTRLRDAQSNPNPPTRMLIRAHPECLHERVVGALDAGNACKMQEVKLLTADPDE